MSFADFPSALPFFEELHDPVKLDVLMLQLGQKTKMDIGQLSIAERNKKGNATTSNRFMKAFDDFANHVETANGGITNASTQDDLLNLYYGIDLVKHKKGSSNKLLEQAWAEDPLTALHIIFYARSIHRGKSLKGPFFNAFCWLLLHHPRTALANLRVLVEGTVRTDAQMVHQRRTQKNKQRKESYGGSITEDWEMIAEEKEYELLRHRDFKPHGYWKDLCTILAIYCQGEVDGAQNDEYLALQWPREERNSYADRHRTRRIRNCRYDKRKHMAADEAAQQTAEFIEKKLQQDKIKQSDARQKKLDIRAQRKRRVCHLLRKDKLYRALHFTVARLFSEQLKKDMAQLEKNRINMALENSKHKYILGHNLSLAAKWAPSLKSCHDKHTLLATSIAEALFPPSTYQEKDESRIHYLNKVRDMYRKQYLVPLRAAIDLPEHYMQEGKWDKIDIRHMPSVCLQKHMGLFFKHAPDTVVQYMEDVAKGKKKVSGATSGPHELVYKIRTGSIDSTMAKVLQSDNQLHEKFLKTQAQMVNGQWDTLIASIRNTSLLQQQDDGNNKQKHVDLGECIAVCDVSGSMFCTPAKPENQPINAAIGLSLVISNLAKPPFQGGVITFTSDPQLFHVDTSAPFDEQVNTVLQSDMGYNTDIAKVFTDVLLPMAEKHKLAPEDMVKRLFIFSDMEFDAVDNGVDKFMTTHDFIVKQFEEAGYAVPELVWWNLAASQAYSSADRMNAPVTKDDSGVALLSGFSAAMVKTFLDGEVDQDDIDEKDTEIKEEKRKLTPMEFLKKAVYHESFNGLVVID